MKDDALVILDYLTDNDGVMEYTANTDVETIERVFKMSKAAFKRALGNLYKDREIEFKDDFTLNENERILELIKKLLILL